jgi:hypothetical protein
VVEERLNSGRSGCRWPADVDPALSHRLDRQRMHSLALGARALHVEALTSHGTQEPFGHLTAGGVVGADEQNPEPP